MYGAIIMSHPSDLKAVIFDLDGVITHTAKIHAQAWKQMFDTFLSENSQRTSTPFVPMDPVNDYKVYVDGRPRYEGAQAFLLSRGINLPYGTQGDLPGTHTVCGLANKKNEIYLSILQEQGAQVYEDTIDAIKKWRQENKKTAVISASKNCRQVLEKAGITELFDAIVDGVDSLTYNIKGKPEPDIFLFAAKLLHVDPKESAIVEDSTAGVKAGRDGHFAFIIGVSRNHHARLLYENGADIVVNSLRDLPQSPNYQMRPIVKIPSALKEFETIKSCFANKRVLLLLDYDGTLTSIVERPELAIMNDSMRNIIRSLSERVPVAIVSGRDLADVKRLVGLKGLFYAGSHGFEIEGPGDIHIELGAAKTILPDLDKAEIETTYRLGEIQGILLERKKFGLAVHYRLVNDNNMTLVHNAIDKLSTKYDRLIITTGKKVFELRPRIPWDKGKAVARIAEIVFGKKSDAFPFYIGDDLTDEDAFREVKGWGFGILVGNHGNESLADYRLEDVREVGVFLKKII
jgi:trehalose-phosphatase